jgi:hypothetical protein
MAKSRLVFEIGDSLYQQVNQMGQTLACSTCCSIGRSFPRWVLVGLILVVYPPNELFAQTTSIIGQPVTDFYGASGNGVKASWSVDRMTVPEDEAILATLTITGVNNPQQIIRPDLRKLPEFQDRFIITDGIDPPPEPDAKSVHFTYHLRPRNRTVDKIPTLKFRWYNPAAAVAKQYPTARAEFVAITVTEATLRQLPPPQPLDVPESWLTITTGPTVLTRTSVELGYSTLLLVVLGPPVAASLWYLAWKRWYPDSMRLARLRRSRAAWRALERIRRSGRTDDPPYTVARAMLDYLQERFQVPNSVATASEASAALEERHVPLANCEAVAQFLRRCDAARFAPVNQSSNTLTSEAKAIIARLEAT